ncbi:hypothetical protein MUY35_08360 [Aliiroseovarius sp. S1339]|uniref:hypothetical protein n=1 Tax=Aliiroseovarius sp. S1339 TaxID=2936990 RepID=UPI0020BE8A11|nr:hypothetical protein [Aliiroseovarius sp. S1339]MCK8463858.1 hypothetical protein [Aliiroseovarius sp. S1339]
MPLRPLIFTAILPGLLMACAPAPDFPAGAAANAPFPKIVPVDQIQSQLPVQQGDDGISALAARAADLRTRAAAMRGTSVVDPATEGELQDALDPS